jgi:hypothetical protein
MVIVKVLLKTTLLLTNRECSGLKAFRVQGSACRDYQIEFMKWRDLCRGQSQSGHGLSGFSL